MLPKPKGLPPLFKRSIRKKKESILNATEGVKDPRSKKKYLYLYKQTHFIKNINFGGSLHQAHLSSFSEKSLPFNKVCSFEKVLPVSSWFQAPLDYHIYLSTLFMPISMYQNSTFFFQQHCKKRTDSSMKLVLIEVSFNYPHFQCQCSLVYYLILCCNNLVVSLVFLQKHQLMTVKVTFYPLNTKYSLFRMK